MEFDEAGGLGLVQAKDAASEEVFGESLERSGIRREAGSDQHDEEICCKDGSKIIKGGNNGAKNG